MSRFLKCDHVSDQKVKCLRRALQGGTKCSAHFKPEKPAHINSECPICLESEEKDMYLLSCHHRCHLECLKGMNSIECPLCRTEIINLPNHIKQTILDNSKKYKEEQINEEHEMLQRAFQQELASSEYNYRIPPQMEIVMAMRYLYELGIPPSRIPSGIELTIDPESPLPDPGSIFQVAVRRMIDVIQRQVDEPVEEEDCSEPEVSGSETEDDEENPFLLEGLNPHRISHTVRTSPIPGVRSIAQEVPMLFNTMRVILSELDALGVLSSFGDDSDSD